MRVVSTGEACKVISSATCGCGPSGYCTRCVGPVAEEALLPVLDWPELDDLPEVPEHPEAP